MKKEIIQEWIAALRSGQYSQTYGKLQRTQPHIVTVGYTLADEIQPIGYCCLGVLGEILVTKGMTTKRDATYGVVIYGDAVNGFEESTLNAVGLTESQQRTLVAMNDGDRASFSTIADYIEKEILPHVKE